MLHGVCCTVSWLAHIAPCHAQTDDTSTAAPWCPQAAAAEAQLALQQRVEGVLQVRGDFPTATGLGLRG